MALNLTALQAVLRGLRPPQTAKPARKAVVAATPRRPMSPKARKAARTRMQAYSPTSSFCAISRVSVFYASFDGRQRIPKRDSAREWVSDPVVRNSMSIKRNQA
jgi:hypothetical protein